MEKISQQVAETIVNKSTCLIIDPDNPIKFTSGIYSPVYVNWRWLPSSPKAFRFINNCILQQVTDILKNQRAVSLASIESGGNSYASVLADRSSFPCIYVKKEVKNHGIKSLIDPNPTPGNIYLPMDDVVSKGGSMGRGIEIIREAGGNVNDCFANMTYQFPESGQLFRELSVVPYYLTTFTDILKAAKKAGLDNKRKKVVDDWQKDPSTWAQRNGIGL